MAGACSPAAGPPTLLAVAGGTLTGETSQGLPVRQAIAPFYLGRYEVTQREWVAVMGHNPAPYPGNSLPVTMVSWYDCVAYCNARSLREGLTPYYTVRPRPTPPGPYDLDASPQQVTANAGANGYRLPTAAEWQYAATGGRQGRHYTYSGSNTLGEVAWYWRNAGDAYLPASWSWPELVRNHNRSRPVGRKQPNELGFYDMSGNVREWCADWHAGRSPEDPAGRLWKGGGWMGADFCCEPAFAASYQADGKGPDQGFRVCRSLGQAAAPHP